MASSAQARPVAKNNLNFFAPPNVQVSQIGYQTIVVKPFNNFNSRSKRIEFFHPGKSDDRFRGPQITVHLKLALKQPDGTNLAQGKEAAFITYFCQTLISSYEIFLNGVQITRNTDNYPYKAVIEGRLMASDEGAKCQLAAAGYYQDTGTGDQITGYDKANNSGVASRFKLTENGRIVEVICTLHTDLGRSHLILPNGLDLAVNLNLVSDAFALVAPSGVTSSDVAYHLIDAALHVDLIHVNPAVHAAIERVFLEKNAVIPLQTCEVHAVNLPGNQAFVSVDNLYQGKLPSVLIMGLVDNSAYSGSLQSNPFAFRHYALKQINLYVNGVMHTIGPFDFDQNQYVLGYHSLMKASGLLANGQGSLITMENYPHGSALYGIDLSPEGGAASYGTHTSVAQIGSIRVEFLFNTAPPNPVTVLFYSITEGSAIEITKNRDVYVSR